MPTVETIATTELGDRSYVVHDGSRALVIDPQRDLDRFESVLEAKGLVLDLVLETHLHNDYVSGGLALAARHGARYGVAASSDVAFERTPLADGDELAVGTLTARVVATPGHTDSHLAFIVTGGTGGSSVFSGGSLLFGSVGRTDLLGAELTERLTHDQFRSVRALAGGLADGDELYPTHGFGSFCTSGASAGADRGTIGDERRRNDALLATDEDDYVASLIAHLSAYPSYYAHMGPMNRLGPSAARLVPVEAVDPEALAARIHAGEWVIDLRPGGEFALIHLDGTVSMPVGDSFSTYVGWIIPWHAPITLVAEAPSDIALAQRQLARIGIDELAGAATGAPHDLAAGGRTASYRSVRFGDVDPATGIALLDVRRDDERQESHIPGSLHIPIHALLSRMGELPHAPLWVHCASGYRAAIAASLLARARHDVVLVDDDFATAVTLGLATK